MIKTPYTQASIIVRTLYKILYGVATMAQVVFWALPSPLPRLVPVLALVASPLGPDPRLLGSIPLPGPDVDAAVPALLSLLGCW